ncbi:hypothetical protein JCM10908_005522 [Rhodotorula pacifica]|uniref:uncharacterized protein n=1 Tax=Rhodotorula pacifica TaxID=1495444 RepID=UPI00317DCE5D
MPSAAPLHDSNKTTKRAFYGFLVHSVSLTEIEYLENALLGVDETGVIAFLEKGVPANEVDERIRSHGWTQEDVHVVEMKRSEFLMPGLIDTHTHAPQYLNLGYGQQYELLDWLDNLTFPAEAKFADAAHARRVYDSVVERVISTGTTTCCWYGTIHSTTKILAAVCHRRGQRAFVGKCNMDRNSADYYQEESAQKSLEDTADYVSWVRSRCGDSKASAPSGKTPRRSTALVQPILTPRFAISCSDELMSGLGDMMDRDPDLPLQTHLAENPAEVEFALSLYPGIESYTAAYDRFRLLRPNTVLAHCVFLSGTELDLIKARQSGISHCANSNFNLRSGTARVADMLDKGIKVSLGTDNSGGIAIGILSALRSASTCSKTIIFHERNKPADKTSSDSEAAQVINTDGISRPAGFFASTHLSVETLFYLATLGGAQVCNLEDRIGNFVVGKEFDALLVQTGQKEASTEVSNGAVNGGGEASLEDELEKALTGGESVLANGVENPALMLEPDEGIERVFEKFLFTGDDRNLRAVFVRGRQIGGRETL